MAKVIHIWNEFEHEHTHEEVRKVYPDGIHEALADILADCPEFEVRTSTLRDPNQGLDEETLAGADVIAWWGHMRHRDVADENAERVAKLVEDGVGLVPVHSSHFSKPFVRLMGTTCGLGSWREEGEPEHIEVVAPDHPVASGLPSEFTIPHTEMYSEKFDVPEPEAVVLQSKWDRGETFRSCCTWKRGKGRIVYVRPGHESYPIFRDENFKRLFVNAVKYAAQLS